MRNVSGDEVGRRDVRQVLHYYLLVSEIDLG